MRERLGTIKTAINMTTGRILFGNIATFGDNTLGSIRLNNNRRHLKKNFAISKKTKDLINDGFITYTNFDNSTLKDIYSEYLEKIDDPKYTQFTGQYAQPVILGKEKVYRSLIKDSYTSLPSTKKLLTSEFLEILYQYYQSHFRLCSIYAWRTHHISKEKLTKIYPKQPYSLLWHVDGHPTDTLKIFIALSDIDEKSGPLHYVSKQRTEQLRNMGFCHRFKYNVPTQELESMEHVNKLTGKLGTAAICNTTLCLHKAGIPEKGKTRDILEFQFESSSKPFSVPL